MNELKPCPFCGGRANDEMQESTDCGEFSYAQCMDCGARTDGHITSELLRATLAIAWNTRTDGWISVGEHPKCSGRYTVDSSYGVRDSFFSEGFIVGDFRWQDCETGNDEGVENHDGIEFEVYNWMPLPQPPKVTK